MQRRLRGRGAGVWIALTVAVVAGVATWRVAGTPDRGTDSPLIVAPSDAGAFEARGTLEIASLPAGATVTVGDRLLGPSPQTTRVASGVKVHVKLDLKGYQSYEDDLAVEPGKTVVLRPHLPPAPAVLHVETTPPGATVTLADQPLGTTPLTKPAAVARGVELAISKPGYEPVKVKIDLLAGEQTHVVRELKELQKFGVVLVVVNGSAEWGYVWWRGKNLGQNYTMAGGQTPFRLPVGRQQLTITHPRTAPKTTTVDVAEQGPMRVVVTL